MKETKKLLAVFGVLDAVLLIVCVFFYMGQDRTPPVINFSENDAVYSENMDARILLQGVEAMDEKDGDVTDSVIIEKISDTAGGEVIVTYIALDRANNVVKASRLFTCEKSSGPEDAAAPGKAENAGTENAGADAQTQNVGGAHPEEEGADEQDPDDAEDGKDGEEAKREREADGEQNRQDAEEARRQEPLKPEAAPANQAPSLNLSTQVLPVAAGSESVDWNQCIGAMSDDKDSKELLFMNLMMQGNVDLKEPGDYPVVLYTVDSDGAESAHKELTIHVE